MARSFGIVEDKLGEADFFFEKFRELSRGNYQSCYYSRYYFSAFISASRSVTLALQATMKDVEGFESWYQTVQSGLRSDALAKYFVEIRNDSIHKGINPLNQVALEHLHDYLYWQLNQKKHSPVLIFSGFQSDNMTVIHDALDLSENYFRKLVQLIFDCYEHFRFVIDPQWYFTRENFTAMGKGIQDALAEEGFPPAWALCAPSEEIAWQILRSQQPSCQINDLFQNHLGRKIDGPEELEK